jgi:hypothetical protein
MRDWASSGGVKIERAYEHIRNLEAEISAFRKGRPYRIRPEPNDEHGEVLVIRAREAIPLPWSAIASDAVHNLHVALDYLWQRSIHQHGHVWRDKFPAFRDAKSFKARFKGKEKGRVKTAVDIFRAAKTYKVGNPFWDIRCFDDADKHDTMVLVACRLSGARLDFPRDNVSIRITPSAEQFFVIEDGTVLSTLPIGKMEMDDDIAFEIAFGEGEVLKRQPVIPTLKNLAASVDSLVAAFKAFDLI